MLKHERNQDNSKNREKVEDGKTQRKEKQKIKQVQNENKNLNHKNKLSLQNLNEKIRDIEQSLNNKDQEENNLTFMINQLRRDLVLILKTKLIIAKLGLNQLQLQEIQVHRRTIQMTVQIFKIPNTILIQIKNYLKVRIMKMIKSFKNQIINKRKRMKKIIKQKIFHQFYIILYLIENFKQLYQKINEEKQQLQEKVEKLTNENNQFREIFIVLLYIPNLVKFSKILHLFWINLKQLNEEGEDEYPEEIAQENDNQND